MAIYWNYFYRYKRLHELSNVTVGAPSPALRKALGLTNHPAEIPQFIYRMRTLGYPPGWIRHATVYTTDHGDVISDGFSMSSRSKYDIKCFDDSRYDSGCSYLFA